MALTEGLRDNQKAITKGFEQFERLADMKELPQIEYDDYNLQEKQSEEEPESEEKYMFNVANRFNKKEMEYIYKRL